ncbi:MAG: fluoride efflux transporter CrcB [Rhodospirillaceae bacterium]
MSVQMIVAVAAGGAVGAVGRFLVMTGAGHVLGHGFPYGTMIVNIVGAFALGALIEVSALVWSPSEELRAFLVVGCLGAFTTFSTFSLDAVTLWHRGELVAATVYVGGSVILGLAAFIGGLAALRAIVG